MYFKLQALSRICKTFCFVPDIFSQKNDFLSWKQFSDRLFLPHPVLHPGPSTYLYGYGQDCFHVYIFTKYGISRSYTVQTFHTLHVFPYGIWMWISLFELIQTAFSHKENSWIISHTLSIIVNSLVNYYHQL